MKHLPQYIKEGLFDAEKNITDTHELEKQMFEDKDSLFWQYLIPILPGSSINKINPGTIDKSIDIDKEVIKMPNIGVMLNTDTNYPFVNKYDLICDEFSIGRPDASGPHPNPIDNGGGFKEIRCGYVHIDGFCEKLSGFNFFIIPDNRHHAGRKVRIDWANQLDYFDASFQWTDNKDSVFTISADEFPNLKNVKSNAEKISIYDPMFFEYSDAKNKLDKFFGKGTITANGVTKNKSTRNIIAIANNIKKYHAIDPEQIIPEGSVKDLLDIRGFSDLKYIQIRNNNVCMTFCKSNDEEYIKRHARFIRMNNLNTFKDTPIEEIISLIKRCKTKDDWVLIISPEQFG